MSDWFTGLWQTIGEYMNYYATGAAYHVQHLSPYKYVAVLVTVATLGFLAMGRGNKRI